MKAFRAIWMTVILLAAITVFIPAGASAQAPSHGSGHACTLEPTEVFKNSSPAVVFISVTSINPYAPANRVQRGLGSGFVFDDRGFILTNSHVVFGAQLVSVKLGSGEVLVAQIVGIDPFYDLAVLKIDPPAGKKLAKLTLGDSDKINIGDSAFAIGNPLGLDQTFTAGTISALNRILPETPLSLTRRMIQMDTPINPGNSGGPLINCRGEVIGINTAGILSAQGLGFAVPSNLVRQNLDSLVNNGRIIRPWVGFHGQFIDDSFGKIINAPAVTGLMVEVIEPSSPAELAKMEGGRLDVAIAGREFLIGGDIVTEINGVKIVSRRSLQTAMTGLKVGMTLTLKVLRDGKIITVSYKLPERPILPGDLPN